MTIDAFDLSRFVAAQEDTYARAIGELRRGQKQSHWMWFVFPQIDGLGTSPMATRYAIKSLAEAQGYLAHPILGPRLIECCGALLEIEGRTALEILGAPDDMKLKSSMTLFALVPGADAVFGKVLEKYFEGRADERTRLLLQGRA